MFLQSKLRQLTTPEKQERLKRVQEKTSESADPFKKTINTKNFRFKIKFSNKNFLKYEKKSHRSPPKKIQKYQVGKKLQAI